MHVPVKDPEIYKPVLKFDFTTPPTDPVELVKHLSQVMVENNGIGLSANQLGLPYRVFVMKSNPIIACFNPMIVDQGEDHVVMEEGCLSFPNLFVKIKRPTIIKVRFTEANGNVRTETFDGMTARIFQHEFDHLNGITMMNMANPYHRQQALQRKKKHDRKLSTGRNNLA